MSSNPASVKISVSQGGRSIPKPILLSIVFYLGTLMITQTAYGWPFMPLRWVGLILLATTCGFCWLFALSTGKYRWDPRGLPKVLIFFLAITLISVFTSENFSFSGLRWLSNVMLLLTCIVFLRGIFGHIQAHQMIGMLKAITFLLLLGSFLFPAPKTGFESAYFRGAMNDPNSLGHVTVIAALIFLHGAFTLPSKSWRQVHGLIAAFSIGILVITFARSSMAAFLAGMAVMSLYYAVGRSLLAKAAIFFLIAFTLASPVLQTKITRFVEKDRPQDILSSTIIRLDQPSDVVTPKPTSIFISRESLWADAWEGFIQRPLQGWGFSMNKDTPKTWVIGITSIGMIRDATNDILFILEGSGLLGIIGYVFLACFIWQQAPTRRQRMALQAKWRGNFSKPSAIPGETQLRGLPPAVPRLSPVSSPPESKIPPAPAEWRNHTHTIAYILSVSLWILFLFDGSAFSPGSLISVIFWISTGISSAIWAEVTAQMIESEDPKGGRVERVPKLHIEKYKMNK